MEVLRAYLTSATTPPNSTLAGDITSATSSLNVASGHGSRFHKINSTKSNGVFAVKIDSEYILVTRSGDAMTVQAGGRGAFNTTAAAHTSGATVTQVDLYTLVPSDIAVDRWNEDFAFTSPSLVLESEGATDSFEYFDGGGYSVSIRCFPGRESDMDARVMARLVAEKLDGAANKSTDYGTLLIATRTGGPLVTVTDEDRIVCESSYEYQITSN